VVNVVEEVMGKAEEFLEALRRKNSEGENVDEYWHRQQAAWLDDLRRLGDMIKHWLAPVIDAKLAKVEDMDFQTTEPDVGTYMAPGLSLELLDEAPKVVRIRPRGLRVLGVVEDGGARIVGAAGRVDLECGVARAILLRFKTENGTTWMSFAGGTKRELDEEVFFELLARTADVSLR
jgi:hypothetical protein